MKKTLIISAIALGLAFHSSNATTTTETSEVVKSFKTKVSISPFCMAIVKGDLDMVKELIQLGANVNEQSGGMTPAMYAARYNKVEILELLVKHGAELKRKSDRGLKAMDYAKQSNAKEALDYIKKVS